MYAIVLSHQSRHPFVQLLLSSYDAHWRTSGLTFRVPYDREPPAFTTAQRVEAVRAAKPIPRTMEALLDGIDDTAFVYWCTDDRYVERILDPARLAAVVQFVSAADRSPLDAVRLLTHTKLDGADPANLSLPGSAYLLQRHRAPLARGFWHHHFIRARVLREIFVTGRSERDVIYRITEDLLAGRFTHVIYSPEVDVLQLGEPTIEDAITENGVLAFARHGLPVPAGIRRSSKSALFPAER